MRYLFTTPIAARFADEPALSGVDVDAVSVDLDTGNLLAIVRPVEGGGPGATHRVTIPLPAAQLAAIQAAVKAAVASKLGIALQ